MAFNDLEGTLLKELYDEMNEVYGCVEVGKDDLIGCKDCFWESCPMRGGKKEVA